MPFRTKIKHILFSSGLSKQEYRLVRDRIHSDNQEKLTSCAVIVTTFLTLMLILSFLIDSIGHSRNVYLVSLLATNSLHFFAYHGKRHRHYTAAGIYLFTALAFSFGLYQALVTSPQEQTVSYIALVLAVPFWFGMIPIRMITSIVLFTVLFIVGALHVKTGYVLIADIVNAVVYSAASAIISTYATCVKSKRFYAEYLTEQIGKTDTLTLLGNRLAYTEYMRQYPERNLPEHLTIWCFDVNELKLNNDTMGHHAGDELLRSAADCMNNVFGNVGKCFRTGGDEFIAVTETSPARCAELCAAFDSAIAGRKTMSGRPLRVSYGYACAHELPGKGIQTIMSLADNRLYEAKEHYYRTNNENRHGHEEAINMLSSSYSVIMKVDLTNDTFRRLRNEINDKFERDGFIDSFSKCMADIADSGIIHPDDAPKYREKTQLDFLRDYFRSGKQSLHIFYRRKIGDTYFSASTEILTAREYTDEQQIVYLYVKILNS